jgi:hypothetical protein
MAKAWDMRGIDDPPLHTADYDDAGQMPSKKPQGMGGF